MKSAFPNFLVVFALLSLFACGGNPADTTDNTNPITDVGANSDTTSSIPVPVEVQKPTCEKIGTMLEGNEFWAQDVNKLVRIVATEETKDPNLGDSHRVLQVYDGMNCQLMNEKILPVDVSADFAYTIADITYNNDSKIIAIQSFKKIYCYDILNDKLFRSVEPKFINERFAEDAQSGQIKRLEVWEDYLIGYAQDLGSFVFSVKDGQPTVVKPFAEFEILEGKHYSSMFLLKSKDNTYQAIVPTYDVNTAEFKVNPMLPEPLYISNTINPRYRNNRYQLLKEVVSDGEKNMIAVDMKTSRRVELPAAISKRKNTEILGWLKANTK
jgi:hypothetical protein